MLELFPDKPRLRACSGGQQRARPSEEHWIASLLIQYSSRKQIKNISLSGWGITETTIKRWTHRSNKWLPGPQALSKILRSRNAKYLTLDDRLLLCDALLKRVLESTKIRLPDLYDSVELIEPYLAECEPWANKNKQLCACIVAT